jgi:hypothetical protein
MDKLKQLTNRINSQSKRIRKLNQKLARIETYRKYYQKHRLDKVIEREKTKSSFCGEMKRATKVLSHFRKNFFISNISKSRTKKRYIGLFTHVEMQRLRKFLNENHKNEYFAYRYKNYSVNKNKGFFLLTNKEKHKLKRMLNPAPIKFIHEAQIGENKSLQNDKVVI